MEYFFQYDNTYNKPKQSQCKTTSTDTEGNEAKWLAKNQGITSRRTHEGNLTQVLYSWIYLYNTNDHTTLS